MIILQQMKKFFYIHSLNIWNADEVEAGPDISFVPPLLRRRLSEIEKITFYLGQKSAPDYQNFRTVFASDFGEWTQTIQLIQQFYEEGQMSPAKFSTSVHNAGAGLFSLFRKNYQSYTCIAANEATLQAGLLEAFITPPECLFVFAQETTPDFYKPVFENPYSGHGLAFFISEKESNFKIEVDFKTNNCDVLSFSELVEFFKTGKTLTTPLFEIRKLK